MFKTTPSKKIIWKFNYWIPSGEGGCVGWQGVRKQLTKNEDGYRGII